MTTSTASSMSTFQSTHPVRGGTTIPMFREEFYTFQSTHPVRGGTGRRWVCDPSNRISIHPPREGWDGKLNPITILANNFNPPTP